MKRTLYHKEYYQKRYRKAKRSEINKDGIIEERKSNKGVYKDFHLFDISHMRVLVYFD